ncbi:hypothetical protein E2R33_09750 [Rathayibacter toxicus]|uniref:hypothetical protein n=1 Tax=Rathayibacter toxicus TaxID=145458 RepID=UPI001C052267|nr:hypothetical protein [Rathayibacter toxicus]QWL28854.1 hypothetical protein E2R33_09750 [Rathayibacter toxicus]QWL30959.1 hypothetical protein E2R34_09535 [Rathayibacter toxicus]
MTRSFSLSYRDSVLVFHLYDGVDIDPALAFLGSHFHQSPELSSQPLASIDVFPLPSIPQQRSGEKIYVRKSASDFFTIPALRELDLSGKESVFCERTSTQFEFDRHASRISVHVGAEGQRDLIELVRDLVLKDQENRGALVLHSTAAVRDGRAVLIAGLKGAGKSTILLELVEHCGYRILSGDKTLVRQNSEGAIVVTGWPDYPHLGYATIAKYEELPAIAGIADDYPPPDDHAFSPKGKFAVDPQRFRERFPSAEAAAEATVEGILFPSIGPGECTVFTPVEWSTPDAAREYLISLEESPFSGKYSSWHHYSEPCASRHSVRRDAILNYLVTVPAWRVTGPGDVSDVPWSRVSADV